MSNQGRIVVYPGSFDPVTNGHLDIIHRARHIFDHVIVAVTQNSAKNSLFTVQERVDLLSAALKKEIRSRSVSVDTFSGLLVDYCRRRRAVAVARGLRALSDFEYEFQMAITNKMLYKNFEVIFLMSDIKWANLSSSIVKEIIELNGDTSIFVPKSINDEIKLIREVSK